MEPEKARLDRHPCGAPELSSEHIYEVGKNFKRNTAAQCDAGEQKGHWNTSRRLILRSTTDCKQHFVRA